MKISQAFDLYLEEYIRFKNQSARTEEAHNFCRSSLKNHLGDISMRKLTMREITSWRKTLELKKLSASTIRYYVIRLRCVVSFCNLRGIPCLNSGLIPVPQRGATVPVFLTADEVAQLISAGYDARAKFLISLLYSSGVRLSELISLDRGQIVERRFTVIGKGKKARLCFIDQRTEELMDEYLATRTDRCPALIVSKLYKERMTATNIQLMIRNTTKKAGINKRVTPHTLRHSYATNFLKNNGNMRYLSAMMGHASMDTTAMYAHVVDNDMEAQYRRFHTI